MEKEMLQELDDDIIAKDTDKLLPIIEKGEMSGRNQHSTPRENECKSTKGKHSPRENGSKARERRIPILLTS